MRHRTHRIKREAPGLGRIAFLYACKMYDSRGIYHTLDGDGRTILSPRLTIASPESVSDFDSGRSVTSLNRLEEV